MTEETSGLREHMGIRYVGVVGDAVVLEMRIGPQHQNLASTLHGGAIATLVDIACALAARTPSQIPSEATPVIAGRVATISLTLHCTRAVREGNVTVMGRKMAGGRKVAFASAEVFDDKGRLVANGSGSYAVLA